MKNLSIAVPSFGNFAPAAAPPFDIRTLDASSILLKLSVDLLPTDQLTIYGTLDATATPSSPNLNLLGTVAGNNGQAISGEFVYYWPYLYIERTAGTTPTSPTSLFFASSATAIGTPNAPLTTALPPLTFFSSLINLAPFGNPVRVGLSANQTEIDTFNLYGTDDPTTVGFPGGTLLASLQGGGAQGSNVLVSAYQYVYVLRTGGFTFGDLLAWGADDSGGGGGGTTPPINLGSLTVGNTMVSGNIGTPPLTAPRKCRHLLVVRAHADNGRCYRDAACSDESGPWQDRLPLAHGCEFVVADDVRHRHLAWLRHDLPVGWHGMDAARGCLDSRTGRTA